MKLLMLGDRTVRARARIDRPLAWWRGSSVRYLVIDIEVDAGDVRASQASDRPPHNLAVVIDASRSMQSAPLAGAKQVAEALIRRLDDRDTLAVLSTAERGRVVMPSSPMTRDNRAEASRQIEGIVSASNTDLIGGWLLGTQEVSQRMQGAKDAHNRVVVLSDGHAHGEGFAPERVAHHAREITRRGLNTSAIGIGFDCDLVMLIALDSENALPAAVQLTTSGLVDALARRFLELTPVAAVDVRLHCTLPPGIVAELLGPGELGSQDGEHIVRLGTLRAGSSWQVVLKLTLPAGQPGDELPMAVIPQWTSPDGQKPVVGEASTFVVTLVEGRVNSAQPQDTTLALMVASAWRIHLLRTLLRLNGEGRFREAETVLTREMKFLERYVHNLPGGEPLLGDLRRALRRAHAPWRDQPRPR